MQLHDQITLVKNSFGPTQKFSHGNIDRQKLYSAFEHVLREICPEYYITENHEFFAPGIIVVQKPFENIQLEVWIDGGADPELQSKILASLRAALLSQVIN